MRNLPENYKEILFPLLSSNTKLVLGGSIALHLLNIMEYNFSERIPDIDLSLKAPLTENELNDLIKTFDLKIKASSGYDYDESIIDVGTNDEESMLFNFNLPIIQHSIKPTSHFLHNELIQLEKLNSNGSVEFKIDIFNSRYIKNRDIVKVIYNESLFHPTPMFLLHPSEILSYKAKYAYDNRVKKSYKHFEDIKNMDWNKYFKILNSLQPVVNESDNRIIQYYQFK